MPNETKQSCATAYKTMIGGQALIEGIMMLGPEKKAVVVRKPDGGLEEQVEERVRRLAQMPPRFKAPTAAAPSMDAVRIENELKLCFNRAELNPEYIETLIFAAAAERYRELPDPAPRQKGIERGRQAQENPLDGKRLWDFFDVAVSAVRMGQKCLELELAANVTIQTREEEPA